MDRAEFVKQLLQAIDKDLKRRRPLEGRVLIAMADGSLAEFPYVRTKPREDEALMRQRDVIANVIFGARGQGLLRFCAFVGFGGSPETAHDQIEYLMIATIAPNGMTTMARYRMRRQGDQWKRDHRFKEPKEAPVREVFDWLAPAFELTPPARWDGMKVRP